MKLLTTLALIVSSAFIGQPDFAAENAKPDIEALRSRFVNPPPGSGTTPFLSLGGTLTKENIRQRMIEAHEKEGFGGVAPEASRNLKPAYPSDEYFDVYGSFLETAKELRMIVVFYDEAGFPSGPTGGEYINGNREFAYIHRSAPDAEVYFFANSSYLEVQADITLRGEMALEWWDPHTGTFQKMEGTPAQENGEAVTRFKLTLPAIRSAFIIGRKTI